MPSHKRVPYAVVAPEGRLDVLSQAEVNKLKEASQNGLYELFRRCALAVLNCGSDTDDAKQLIEEYKDFSISVIQQEWGIKLKLKNAPAAAFVDGFMIKGIKEHLFSVLRDIVYVRNEIENNSKIDLTSSEGITNAVFHILRNSQVFQSYVGGHLVVCWGGHSIGREEYDYAKKVGYEMGLRGMNICTGCGPGAMKGPMKGAAIAHAKQRNRQGGYVGLSEPGIIAAEPPNPIVNELVILPDIEKRLEAFVRCGHGVIVFPGGVGTAEEILYILGILLHPNNKSLPFPLILTGPKASEKYFQRINEFIGLTLGVEAQSRYKVIINDATQVAREINEGVNKVRDFRKKMGDSFSYNWMLKIDKIFQEPFIPTHENMAGLALSRNQKRHLLAANLRQAFSGIVAGNVKEQGIKAIEEHGLFEINGDKKIMEPLDALLAAFVEQGRMKLPGSTYAPCYRVVNPDSE